MEQVTLITKIMTTVDALGFTYKTQILVSEATFNKLFQYFKGYSREPSLARLGVKSGSLCGIPLLAHEYIPDNLMAITELQKVGLVVVRLEDVGLL